MRVILRRGRRTCCCQRLIVSHMANGSRRIIRSQCSIHRAQTGMRGESEGLRKKGEAWGYGTIESGDELTLFCLWNAGSPYSVWSMEYTSGLSSKNTRADTMGWGGGGGGYEAEDEDTSVKKVKDAMTGSQIRGFRRGHETRTRLMRIVSMLSRTTNCERPDCKPAVCNTVRSVRSVS